MKHRFPFRLGDHRRYPARLNPDAHREYQYVGPPEILEIARTQPHGTAISSVADLTVWLETKPTEQTPDGNWIATFTLGVDSVLCVAPRRSEHVACAAGGPVLSAGEIIIDGECCVPEISNQSTGFCPEPESWSALEPVLNHAGIIHPGKFTNAVVFLFVLSCLKKPEPVLSSIFNAAFGPVQTLRRV